MIVTSESMQNTLAAQVDVDTHQHVADSKAGNPKDGGNGAQLVDDCDHKKTRNFSRVFESVLFICKRASDPILQATSYKTTFLCLKTPNSSDIPTPSL